ncbi:type 1 glutamine amidotransferase [Roseomonas sp. NAR14]|uniref:Type 1 glutamine amidotransferase n=1 Tax=Roseomonas acroporae TaxID=2937791 RepID=A0A9X2BX20_9PROT|nr:type 1 glutamine amidotransferase domain-containing protein [Roseomonas acroporae]MCK8786731.1 type 1 glutamine amidotransferase [Roseomonas acroporae]
MATANPDDSLRGRVVAILATDGVEQVELTRPREALLKAGAEVFVVTPEGSPIQAYNHDTEKGDRIPADRSLRDDDPGRYDALVLPGGVKNPDSLRTLPAAVAFVRHFVDSGRPIAAICHGPWTLIEADGVRGRHVTSWPSLRTDLTNAGARWSDEPVVTDRGLVTSRKPDDLPDFCRKMIEEIREGRHRRAD